MMSGKIHRILVPVDGSMSGCKAVDEALLLAEQSGAELDFVYVASNINKDIPSHIVFDRIWERLPAERTARRHVKSGNVARSIIEVAEEQQSDMIVMGSRGLGLL